MAYKLISGPTFASLPTEIIDFALNTLGWTSTVTGRVIIPDSEEDLSVAIDTFEDTSGYWKERVRLRFMEGETVTNTAYATTPYIEEAYLTPTAMQLFGGSDPAPWLAAAIEYGAGFFRHVYIGRLVKYGNYTAGEVISGERYEVDYNVGYRDNNNQYLFDGLQNCWNADESGSIRINHADVGGLITAPFKAGTTPNTSAGNENCVFGGFKNHVNDQQVARAQNTFAGVQIFNPINLYLTRAQDYFTPLGYPPGIRLVNMTNLGPSTTVTVANKTWRCIPAFKKGSTAIIYPPSGKPNSYRPDESSYVVGYAYLED